ncbi:MAG: WGR domain-containing protein [Cytophagaceae bacterium]|nr:WGR domain-containing protein [Cytophagaceae bacterium]
MLACFSRKFNFDRCLWKIGTAGRADLKEFQTNLEAEKEANKLVAEKIKKGYKDDNNTHFRESDFWNIIEPAKKSSEGDADYQADLVTELLQADQLRKLLTLVTYLLNFIANRIGQTGGEQHI